MAEYKQQEKDLVFALDIGTRSVIGVVGKLDGDRFKVLDLEMAEHGKRTMMDGQIDDIKQVAGVVRMVTERLQERLGVRLQRVCVAAAGRALRTQSGSFQMELSGERPMDAEQISQLEAGAVSAAEEVLQTDEEARRQFFLVGYTVAQYRMDNYPLTNLQSHSGRKVEADVVATFLPGEVIESLYATMRTAGLQVASMTLEPIAAMNAAIPADLRLLNLALVDIGAGTTDIAICKDGAVVGYTMVTVAGDEITEAIMRAFLVDFKTAERMKWELSGAEDIAYTDVLGLTYSVSLEDVQTAIREPLEHLAREIAKQVVSINGAAPSALFLAGGGSKLSGLCGRVAKELDMDERRVAIAGNNFAKSVFSDGLDLNNPEYATPLGIAVSAGMGLLNDSYVVQLNGASAKLFRNGVLTLRDILQMNGYTYADMIGTTGKSLSVTRDGRRILLRGEPSVPAVLRVNGAEASLSTVVHAGDEIDFIPAKCGADAVQTLGGLLGGIGRALLNNEEAAPDTPLKSGDVILTLPPLAQAEIAASSAPAGEPAATSAAPPPRQEAPGEEAPRILIKGRSLDVILNDAPLHLAAKESGAPYYLMDLLQHSGIDFEHLDRPVRLEVNGAECGFRQELKNGDIVSISRQ